MNKTNKSSCFSLSSFAWRKRHICTRQLVHSQHTMQHNTITIYPVERWKLCSSFSENTFSVSCCWLNVSSQSMVFLIYLVAPIHCQRSSKNITMVLYFGLIRQYYIRVVCKMLSSNNSLGRLRCCAKLFHNWQAGYVLNWDLYVSFADEFCKDIGKEN